jgi:hypothetical protein
MKLTDLQEAKYYGHTIVDTIKAAIENKEPLVITFDTAKQANDASDELQRHFGEPTDFSMIADEWHIRDGKVLNLQPNYKSSRYQPFLADEGDGIITIYHDKEEEDDPEYRQLTIIWY